MQASYTPCRRHYSYLALACRQCAAVGMRRAWWLSSITSRRLRNWTRSPATGMYLRARGKRGARCARAGREGTGTGGERGEGREREGIREHLEQDEQPLLRLLPPGARRHSTSPGQRYAPPYDEPTARGAFACDTLAACARGSQPLKAVIGRLRADRTHCNHDIIRISRQRASRWHCPWAASAPIRPLALRARAPRALLAVGEVRILHAHRARVVHQELPRFARQSARKRSADRRPQRRKARA